MDVAEFLSGLGRARPAAVLIAGPTASGKSALALAIAECLRGTVVNADAMQVYRDLSILTARPGPADLARAPHRLYGAVDAAEAFSVARWLEAVSEVLAEETAAGRTPVLVGGTGLYLAAALEGLSEVPPVPEAVRRRWRERQTALPPAVLHAELAARDPQMAARLRPTDPQRIVRALEVLDATGRSLADWQGTRTGGPLAAMAPERIAKAVLAPDRAVLGRRIAHRFDAMLDAGALAEVERLLARGLDPRLPAMKAIGVAQLSAHLSGDIALATARERSVTASRRYAKRQETWFRHRFADWPRLDPW